MPEISQFTIGGNVKKPMQVEVSEQAEPTIRRDLAAMLRAFTDETSDVDHMNVIGYVWDVYRDGVQDGWHQGVKLDAFVRAVLAAAWRLKREVGDGKHFHELVTQLHAAVDQLETGMILDGIEEMGKGR